MKNALHVLISCVRIVFFIVISFLIQDNNAKLPDHQRHFDPMTRAIDPNSHFFRVLFLTQDLLKKALDPKDCKPHFRDIHFITWQPWVCFLFSKILYQTWNSHGGTCCSCPRQAGLPCQHCRRRRSESPHQSRSRRPTASTSPRARSTRGRRTLLKTKLGSILDKFWDQLPGKVRARPSRMNMTK